MMRVILRWRCAHHAGGKISRVAEDSATVHQTRGSNVKVEGYSVVTRCEPARRILSSEN